MVKTTALAWLHLQLAQAQKQWQLYINPSPSPDLQLYWRWQRRFVRQRLRLGLQIAIGAFLTFMLLRLASKVSGEIAWEPGWLTMALVAQLGLIFCLIACQSSLGRDRPELVFLGAAWSIALSEQVWATVQGIAFLGVYSWTLTFLTLATLIPVRWQWHLAAQLGILLYYYGVNTILELAPAGQFLWDKRQLLYLFWFCCICDVSVNLYERLQRSEFLARRELEREREKSERLLLNILPHPVAQKLKQDHRTDIAESFAEVTVLFADIVGFTQMSAAIPPIKLVELLNQVFSAFDHLAEEHQLEKIKTIGDAYMAVGGLPEKRPDHAEAIAALALDMQQTIEQFTWEENQSFKMRIGINTGPVVAGVIGKKKFIYDLWGDTVNVASRMESQGITGKIQVTAAAYERLKHRFVLEERGTIEIKGKGMMKTYLLLGRREEA